MKTEDQNKLIYDYILSVIDGDMYDVVLNTPEEKISFVYQQFMNWYNNQDQRRNRYNEVTALANLLQGLPSFFNVDFEWYRILEKGKEWGMLSPQATEKKEMQFIENWFLLVAKKFFRAKNAPDTNTVTP